MIKEKDELNYLNNIKKIEKIENINSEHSIVKEKDDDEDLNNIIKSSIFDDLVLNAKAILSKRKYNSFYFIKYFFLFNNNLLNLSRLYQKQKLILTDKDQHKFNNVIFSKNTSYDAKHKFLLNRNKLLVTVDNQFQKNLLEKKGTFYNCFRRYNSINDDQISENNLATSEYLPKNKIKFESIDYNCINFPHKNIGNANYFQETLLTDNRIEKRRNERKNFNSSEYTGFATPYQNHVFERNKKKNYLKNKIYEINNRHQNIQNLLCTKSIKDMYTEENKLDVTLEKKSKINFKKNSNINIKMFDFIINNTQKSIKTFDSIDKNFSSVDEDDDNKISDIFYEDDLPFDKNEIFPEKIKPENKNSDMVIIETSEVVPVVEKKRNNIFLKLIQNYKKKNEALEDRIEIPVDNNDLDAISQSSIKSKKSGFITSRDKFDICSDIPHSNHKFDNIPFEDKNKKTTAKLEKERKYNLELSNHQFKPLLPFMSFLIPIIQEQEKERERSKAKSKEKSNERENEKSKEKSIENEQDKNLIVVDLNKNNKSENEINVNINNIIINDKIKKASDKKEINSLNIKKIINNNSTLSGFNQKNNFLNDDKDIKNSDNSKYSFKKAYKVNTFNKNNMSTINEENNFSGKISIKKISSFDMTNYSKNSANEKEISSHQLKLTDRNLEKDEKKLIENELYKNRNLRNKRGKESYYREIEKKIITFTYQSNSKLNSIKNNENVMKTKSKMFNNLDEDKLRKKTSLDIVLNNNPNKVNLKIYDINPKNSINLSNMIIRNQQNSFNEKQNFKNERKESNYFSNNSKEESLNKSEEIKDYNINNDSNTVISSSNNTGNLFVLKSKQHQNINFNDNLIKFNKIIKKINNDEKEINLKNKNNNLILDFEQMNRYKSTKNKESVDKKNYNSINISLISNKNNISNNNNNTIKSNENKEIKSNNKDLRIKDPSQYFINRNILDEYKTARLTSRNHSMNQFYLNDLKLKIHEMHENNLHNNNFKSSIFENTNNNTIKNNNKTIILPKI